MLVISYYTRSNKSNSYGLLYEIITFVCCIIKYNFSKCVLKYRIPQNIIILLTTELLPTGCELQEPVYFVCKINNYYDY